MAQPLQKVDTKVEPNECNSGIVCSLLDLLGSVIYQPLHQPLIKVEPNECIVCSLLDLLGSVIYQPLQRLSQISTFLLLRKQRLSQMSVIVV